MEALRQELLASDAHVRSAAEAGLTLTDMLRALTKKSADDIVGLNNTITSLTHECDVMKRRIQELLQWRPSSPMGHEDSDDTEDVVSQLRHRLMMMGRRQTELEALLDQYANAQNEAAAASRSSSHKVCHD